MAKQAYEVVLPGKKSVILVKLKASDLEKIYGTANLTGDEVQSLANTKLARAGLRLSIIEVAGRPTSYADLRDGWDDLFDLSETVTLCNVWAKLNLGESGNVEPVPVTLS